jgi:hypothetical protein
MQLEATWSGSREGPSPDTTLHCVGGAWPWCSESAFLYRSLRAASLGRTMLQKCRSNTNAASGSGTPSVDAATHLDVWITGTRTHPGSMSLQSSSLSAAPSQQTTLLTIVVGVSGKKQRRLLERKRKGSAPERMASPRASQLRNQLQQSLLPNRRNVALAGTTLSVAAASWMLGLRPDIPPLYLIQEDGPSGRLPQGTVNVSPLTLKCRWNPNHPDTSRRILHLPPQFPSPFQGISWRTSYSGLRRVNTLSSLHGLLPPDRGSLYAGCP